MDFENLQRELFERKLKMGEYFKQSFGVLKVFITENKLLAGLLIAANIFILFFNFLKQNISLEVKIATQIGDMDTIVKKTILNLVISLGILIISIGVEFIRAIIYSKVTYKIEGRENEYKLKNIAFKYLKFIGVYFLLLMCIGIVVAVLVMLGVILLLLTRNVEIDFLKYLIFGILIATYVIIILLLTLNTLYFIQTFYVRDMTIVDTFKYNLCLCKKNRLRILVPLLIIALINCIFTIPFFIGVFVFMPKYIVFFISIVSGIISVVLSLIATIMNIIIFLNVEYDYLKKQDEEMRKLTE
ncbi:hypothetical protein [Leptotrichia trevisanii]|uniref:hypothetical protein n=1 Tax=Leptotrichia trevisanii TaxID=109328 RepID=UPI0026EBB804|nr:hypothetical protein [Leptotrichia trevisanii]